MYICVYEKNAAPYIGMGLEPMLYWRKRYVSGKIRVTLRRRRERERSTGPLFYVREECVRFSHTIRERVKENVFFSLYNKTG